MALEIKVDGIKAPETVLASVGQRLNLEVVSSDGETVTDHHWRIGGFSVVGDVVMAKKAVTKTAVNTWPTLRVRTASRRR